jgi:hypothetical protein
VKNKTQLLSLLFLSLALPAFSAAQTITYTTMGTLQVVSGADKLGLGGTTVTVTNTLSVGQLPVNGTTNQYTSVVTLEDSALGTVTLSSPVVTINYSGPESTSNNIQLTGTDTILILKLTVSSTIYVPSISSISPEPISLTNLGSNDQIVVADPSSTTTYSFENGTISSVPAASCSYNVTPQSLSFPSSGGPMEVTVTPTPSNCAWTAVTSTPWLSVSPASGTGTGTVTVTALPNTGGVLSGGVATIGGFAVNATEAGAILCTYSVSPPSLSFPATGGTMDLTVIANPSTCAWTATSPLNWLSLSQTSGTGTGTVVATALPNSGAGSLSGTLAVAGESIPASEAGTNACSFTVTPQVLNFIANGGSQTLTLAASSSNCAWTATILDETGNWLSVSPTSGTGSATVTVTAAGNGSGGVKTAGVEVGGTTVAVTQSNTNACTFLVTYSPDPMTFVSSATTGYVTVNASAQTCQWNISSIPTWMTPVGLNSNQGVGSETVTLDVVANVNATPLSGVLTIAGVTIDVAQNGGSTTNPCNYSVSTQSLAFTNDGGTLPLTLGVSGSTCAWTAVSNQAWVTVNPSGGTGQPPQALSVIAQSNSTGQSEPPATITITSTGATPVLVTATEAATACTLSLPTGFTLSYPSQGGTISVPVTASNSACAWSAISTLPWLTFTQGGSIGSATIGAVAATNTTSGTLSGTVTIAGAVIPVTVAGSGSCTFSVSNPTILFPASGGSAVASVVTNGVGCAWTASAPPWVTLSATAGTGSTSILITTVADSTGPSQSGTVVLAGTSIPVSQTGGCTFTISPTSVAVDVRGILQPISVSASSPSCVWSASTPSFATLTAFSGTGSGVTTLSIPYNTTGADISGTLTIGGQNISIVQDFTQQIFTDVPPGTFYFDAVNLLAQKGITSGCGPTIFCPNSNITRAQMAIFLVTAGFNGATLAPSQIPYFADVPVGSFGFDQIQEFYQLGLTDGCGGGNFCPNDPVTRDQSAIFLIKSRYGATTVFDYPPLQIFNDVPPSDFAYPYVQRMDEDGITSGCGNNDFCPSATLTRGDMAIFIMRAIYNAFAPAGTPEIISVVPAAPLAVGVPTSVLITGLNTNFVAGQTLVSAIPGVTISGVLVTGSTTLTATMTLLANAPAQPDSVYVLTGTDQTGGQEEVLPFGIFVP